jgi:hypothetical protein
MAIALVQSVDKVVTGVASTTLAFTSNVTAANLLVVSHAHWQGGTANINTPTDTLLHTYTGVTAQQAFGGGGVNNKLRSFYVENCSGGANTVTFAMSTSTGDITCSVSEWSGAETSTALDKTNTATFSATTTGTAGATGVLTQADEMIYAAVAHDGADTTITEDSADGFTIIQEAEGGTSDMNLATQYKIVSATTDTTPNWTFGASRTGAGHVGTFKATGGAPADQEPALIGGKLTNSLLLEHMVR